MLTNLQQDFIDSISNIPYYPNGLIHKRFDKISLRTLSLQPIHKLRIADVNLTLSLVPSTPHILLHLSIQTGTHNWTYEFLIENYEYRPLWFELHSFLFGIMLLWQCYIRRHGFGTYST